MAFFAEIASQPDLGGLSVAVADKDFRMIIKSYEQGAVHRDRRQRAGAAAESQAAHYLNRDFRDDEEAFVLLGLGLEDRD